MAEPTSQQRAPLVGRLEALIAVAVLGLLGLVAGLVALVMPATTSTAARINYRQSGVFSYHAAVPRGSLYGAAGLTTGDPIATQLVRTVAVGFRYRISPTGPVQASGTDSMDAVVKLGSGLSRHFALQPTKRFTGTTVQVAGQLPVGRIIHYINSSSAALSDNMPSSATVSVVPRIDLKGAISGRPLVTTYAPSMSFAFAGESLTLNAAPGTSSVSSAAVVHQALVPSTTGSVSYRHRVPATMNLWVVRPSVSAVRDAGLGLAVVCIALGLLVARPLLGGRSPSDERGRVRALYGSLLVPVQRLAIPTGAVAEVATMTSLAELAKRYEAMILHHHHDDGDEYMVWDNGMLFRYTTGIPTDLTGRRVTAASRVKPVAEPDVVLDLTDSGINQLRNRRSRRTT